MRGFGSGVVLYAAIVVGLAVHSAPSAAGPLPSPPAGAQPPAASQDWTQEDCLLCHAEEDVVGMAEANPRPGLRIDTEAFADSIHADFDCVFCHIDVVDIPHEAELPSPDPGICRDCHDDVWEEYAVSAHGQAYAIADDDAPTCSTCHGIHDIHPAQDPESRVYPLALPETCGQCHADQRLAQEHALEVPDAYHSFVQGVHGQGLLRSGLLISASCNDCHGAHDIMRSDDTASRIYPTSLPNTCGQCHAGLVQEFNDSIHGSLLEEGNLEAPTCDSCHFVHQITREVVDNGFAAAASVECGNCHADKLSTYRGTYHGKVNALGEAEIAACASCHTAHHILPADDPDSSVAPANLMATCSGCHEGANENFASYIVHADPTDAERFPLLFSIYFGMLGLLTMTMIGGAAHTILWYRRLGVERRQRGVPFERPAYRKSTGEAEYVRFNLFNRLLHILVLSSFILLVATGLPVRFPEAGWARSWSQFFGGPAGAANLHRFGAIVMLVYVILHLGYLLHLKVVKKQRGMFFGADSLLPRYRDWEEFRGHLAWFLGKRPRPRFGRWTYWEKFDYLADAWGVIVFGTTGLIMWYPVFFTRWLPGWTINVAVIIHGIEALLALSFIFVVHFFNAHLRPGKFPMDPVFLTGRMTLEELREERPREYQELVDRRELETRLVGPSSELTRHYARLVGYTALTMGLGVVAVVVVTVLLALFGG